MNEKNSEIWQQGLGAYQAAFHFAHTSLLDAYNAANEKKPTFDPATVEPPSPNASVIEIITKGLEAYKPYSDYQTEIGEATRRIKNYLLQLIAGGHLKAYGYVIPRNPHDKPVLVPRDVWSGKIDWSKSSVIGNGLEFAAVRIVSTSFENQVLEQTNQRQLPKPNAPRGRPSVKIEIQRAYEALRDSGEIDFSKPMSACFNDIRLRMVADNPDYSGQYLDLVDETIRRTISDLFKADRVSNKQ
jgi:hypothetical protein